MAKCFFKEEKKQDKEFVKLDKMFGRRWSKWA